MGLSTEGIIDAYFNEDNKLVEHQINSYNYYVDHIIPDIISQNFPITLKYNDQNIKIKKIIINAVNYNVSKPISIENNLELKLYL